MSAVVDLAAIFAQLSVLAVGGVVSVLPEMQRQVVEVHRWMGQQEFAALFALAQAAPGPNMMVSTLVGWRVAGLPGALAATAGMVGPSSILTYAMASAWHRFRQAPWRRAIQAGLTPVTVGLVAAGAALLSATTTHGLITATLTAATAVVAGATRLHPLWMLAAGALAGAAFSAA
jgi:chromate transporter